MIGLLMVSGVAGGLWASHTQGKTLEQIEVERYGTFIDAAPDPLVGQKV
jgi:hypothetical protein